MYLAVLTGRRDTRSVYNFGRILTDRIESKSETRIVMMFGVEHNIVLDPFIFAGHKLYAVWRRYADNNVQGHSRLG